MITPELIHYLAAGMTIALGGLGGGIGLGIAANNSIQSMTRQTTGNEQGFRALIIGLALIESGVIIALVMTLLMLFGSPSHMSMGAAIAEIGIALAVGIASLSIGIASSMVVKATSQAIARQPVFAQKLIAFMLLAQSVIEAPVIFAFIVGLLIKTRITPDMSIEQGLQFLASGGAIALGCIGTALGQSIFTHAACTSVGVNKNAYPKLFTFSLLCEAIIETPVILTLLFAFLTAYATVTQPTALPHVVFLLAALTVGLGALGGGTAMGFVASRSIFYVAQEPSLYGQLLRATLLSVAFIESTVIYALIIALFLLLRVARI